MIIKLYQPPSRCWLLVAEQLDDPPNWDRFLPSHLSTSERFRFDTTVRKEADGNLKMKPCKDMLKGGMSAFEYDFEAEETDVLSHAITVASCLGLDLNIGEPAAPGGSSGRSAA